MEIRLSKPSKMPCPSWGIPAKDCITGRKLNKLKNSVCSICYALSGAYIWPTVKNAYENRLKAFKIDPTDWADSMIAKLSRRKKNKELFRWLDSGDLQSIEMLEKIVYIAFKMPKTRFWLPTREEKILLAYIKKHGANTFPDNLIIRLSDNYINKDRKLNELLKQAGILQSGVSNTGGHNCLAYTQDGKCHGKIMKCSACWDKDVQKITYPEHN